MLAERHYLEAIRIGEAIGQLGIAGRSVANLGESYLDQGRLAEARVRFEAVLAQRLPWGPSEGLGFAHLNLGEVELEAGDLEAAEAHYHAAATSFEAVGFRSRLANAYQGLAAVEARTGRAASAARRLGIAATILGEIGWGGDGTAVGVDRHRDGAGAPGRRGLRAPVRARVPPASPPSGLRPDSPAASASSRRSSARIAASSSGSAWSQPQRCSAPCVTSRRSSSAAVQRHVAGLAAATLFGLLDRPLDADHDIAELQPLPGRQRERRRRCQRRGPPGPARMRRERLRGQQRERQHVRRPVLAHVGRVELGELGVVGQDQRHPSRRRRPGRLQRRRDRRREPRREGPPAGRPHAAGRRCATAPAGGPVTADAAPLVAARPRVATRARRPCSAGTRSAGGTSRAAAETNASRMRSMSRRVRSHSSNWPSARRSSMIRADHRPDRCLVARGERAHRCLDPVGEHDDRRLLGLGLGSGVTEPALRRRHRRPSCHRASRGRRTVPPPPPSPARRK